jgi:hypothetical protein
MDNNQNILSSNELVNASSNEVLFENIIENIINNYVDNNQQTQPTNEPQNIPRQTNNQQYVENMSMIHALRDVLLGYNTNIREYQENIRNFLNIIHTTQLSQNNMNNMNTPSENIQNQYIPQPPRQQPQPQQQQHEQTQQSRTGRTTMYNIRQPTNRLFASPSNNRTSFTVRPIQTTPRNPMNNRPIVSETREFTQLPSIISNILNTDASILLSDRNIASRIGRGTTTGLFTNFRDVVVYPSQSQITNATRNIEFSDSSANMNTSCPITLDEFQNGDVVRQIIPCGHIFQESALRNWFTRNVRCPVCRYDIRDYMPSNTSNSDGDISNNPININGMNGMDYNADTDTDSDDDVGPSFGNINRPNPPNTPISQRTTTAANNVNRIVNNIINSTTRTLDEMLNSYMSNYTDTSDNLIYRVEIPLYYNEYYDASDNYIGEGDLMPDYDVE